MNRQTCRLWLWLAGVNLLISAFTFGGGYVVVPMVRKYFVERRALFSEEELLNMAAVAQSTPGAIAVNLSALAGYRTAGAAGVIISSVAAVVPPLVILAVISAGYAAFAANAGIAAALKGMQSGAAALIVDLTVDMTARILRERSLLLTLLIPAAFLANFFLKVNVAAILSASCCLCVAEVWLRRRAGGES